MNFEPHWLFTHVQQESGKKASKFRFGQNAIKKVKTKESQKKSSSNINKPLFFHNRFSIFVFRFVIFVYIVFGGSLWRSSWNFCKLATEQKKNKDRTCKILILVADEDEIRTIVFFFYYLFKIKFVTVNKQIFDFCKAVQEYDFSMYLIIQ